MFEVRKVQVEILPYVKMLAFEIVCLFMLKTTIRQLCKEENRVNNLGE